MSGRLDGKRVFVTGASRGIGKAIAERFAQEGASVALAARSVDDLEAASEAIDGETLPVRCDVTETESVEAALEETVDAFGGLDVSLNSAGVILRADIEGTSDEDLDWLLDVNLKGTMRVARAAVPHLRETSGTIVNVSSQLGEVGLEGVSAYCASKGGINNFTRQLAVQYAPDDVNVNALAPGVIATPMNETVRSENPEWVDEQLQYIPLDRLGTVEDVTGPAVFLASDESNYMTGHVMVVDGGWIAR